MMLRLRLPACFLASCLGGCGDSSDATPTDQIWDACALLTASEVAEHAGWSEPIGVARNLADVDWQREAPIPPHSFALSQCAFDPPTRESALDELIVVARLSGRQDRTPTRTREWLDLSHKVESVSRMDCVDGALVVPGELHVFLSRGRRSVPCTGQLRPWQPTERELFVHLVLFGDGLTKNQLSKLGGLAAQRTIGVLDDVGSSQMSRQTHELVDAGASQTKPAFDSLSDAVLDFPGAAAQALCFRAGQCCNESSTPPNVPLTTPAECAALVTVAFGTVMPNATEAVAAGRLDYQDDIAGACLEQYLDLGCDELVSRRTEFPCAADALVPLSEIGDPCLDDIECKSGACRAPRATAASNANGGDAGVGTTPTFGTCEAALDAGVSGAQMPDEPWCRVVAVGE